MRSAEVPSTGIVLSAEELFAISNAFCLLGAICQDDDDPQSALDPRMSAFDTMKHLKTIEDRSRSALSAPREAAGDTNAPHELTGAGLYEMIWGRASSHNADPALLAQYIRASNTINEQHAAHVAARVGERDARIATMEAALTTIAEGDVETRYASDDLRRALYHIEGVQKFAKDALATTPAPGSDDGEGTIDAT